MPTGLITSYELTTGVIVDMSEAIYMISPVDTPLTGGVGADGLTILPIGEPATQKKVEFQDESLLTPRSTLSSQVSNTTTVFPVAAGDELKFISGDVIMVGAHGEYVQVTNAAIVSGQITVTRAFAGTAATAVTGTALVGVGSGLPEGSDPGTIRSKDRTARYNMTQIFGPYQVGMSRTDTKIRRYGVASEWDKQLMNRITEMGIGHEQALLYGTRTEDTTNKIRTMGGLWYWINALGVIDSSTTALTPTAMQTNMQSLYNLGGVPNIFMANPVQTKNLTDIGTLTTINEGRGERGRGREPVQYVDTEFGRITVVRNRWMINSDAFFWRRENVRRRILDTLQFEWLAKTGDSKKGQIVMEETIEVVGAQHMGAMTALA